MKEIRLANKIICTLVKDRMQYPGRLIVDTVAIIARCGLLLVLYWYVFGLKGGSVNNTNYAVLAWSVFFYFAFSSLRLRDISREIMADVQTGNVEVLFNKPVSYLGYKIWWQISSGLYSFLVIIILGVLVMAMAIGLPATMTIGIFLPTFFLALAGAVVLSLAIYSIVGLLAFWMEDVNPVFWLIDKTVMVLGGSFLPVALFPPFMYKMALYSPFGASQFITHTVYDSWAGNWQNLIGIQIFWIIVLASATGLMFKKARDRVSVNGG